MARMPDGFVDMTLTSPPYDNLRTYNNNIDKTWNQDIWQEVIKSLYRITKQGGIVVWIVNDATINGSETGTSFKQALYAMEVGFSLHDTMIYHKSGLTYPETNRYFPSFEYMFIFSKGKPSVCNQIKDKYNVTNGNKNVGTERKKDGTTKKKHGAIHNKVRPLYSVRQNVWTYATGQNNNSKDAISFNHPAIFPEKLAADHIYSWSNEGDLVYDPFMGSGTTAKMAHIYKRKWIGSEINAEYVELANKRIEAYINQLTLF